jgi:hypothetical protein
MNENQDFPYVSNAPLSLHTEWVAVPIYISVRDKGFSYAIKSAKDTLLKTYTVLKNSSDSENDKLLLLEFNEEFENLKAIIEFVKVKEIVRAKEKRYEVRIYNYFIIKFSTQGEFWGKIEYLSKLLDTLYNHLPSYKSNKNMVVEVGKNCIHPVQLKDKKR